MAETPLTLGQHLEQVRRIIRRDFYTTIDKEQALIRLAEFEMWMRHAKPKPEAAGRHIIEAGSEYHDEETLPKVFGVLLGCGANGDEAREMLNSLQNAGILFRERREEEPPDHKRRVR